MKQTQRATSGGICRGAPARGHAGSAASSMSPNWFEYQLTQLAIRPRGNKFQAIATTCRPCKGPVPRKRSEELSQLLGVTPCAQPTCSTNRAHKRLALEGQLVGEDRER